jgi:2-polyprenyl-3-methyl-5-hydroxy-6-metoxy-1,4-benzoquinol methylase
MPATPTEQPSPPAQSPAEITIGGMHDALIGSFSSRVPPPARVLDLGAGTGAWASRLVEAGYDVVAVERVADRFVCRKAKLVAADLNGDFAPAVGGPFDAVTSIEVIEHLENPRHFLRQAKQLLKPDGLMFVTTPNIECVPARIRFLMNGELRMFGQDPAVNDPTHITPIHTYMFQRMLSDVGFELVDHSFNRPQPTVARGGFRLISRLVGPLLRGVTGGDCHIFVLSPKGG